MAGTLVDGVNTVSWFSMTGSSQRSPGIDDYISISSVYVGSKVYFNKLA